MKTEGSVKSQYGELIKNLTGAARRTLVFMTGIMTCLAFAAGVSAVTLDGSSRSYLRSEDSISRDNMLPAYEYLDLLIRDIGAENISIHFGGWARYDFNQEDAAQDLQYAFLSYKRKYDNTVVNVGRVMVFEGVAAERVDGIYARTDLKYNFGISAFGGRPAETGVNFPGSNIIYGARLFHQTPNVYMIGVSYLREEKNGSDFREEEGVDLWLRPIDKVELLGRSSYNSVTRGWMEHAYNIVLGPFDRLRFVTQASNVHYRDFVTESTTPALQFIPPLLEPNESATIIGEEASFAATDAITVFANYQLYDYKIAGNATSYGGRVNYSRSRGNAAGFSVDRTDGDEERLKYTEYRLYGARMLGKFEVALDLIDLAFDQDISGTGNSYSASIAANYELARSLRLGADFEYRTSPMLTRDHLTFVKIIYLFGTKIGEGI